MKMLNLNKNRKTKTNVNLVKVMSFAILMITLISVSNLFATDYYSYKNGDPNNTDSWKSLAGNKPGNFSNSNDLFIIKTGFVMSITNNDWTISAQLQINSGGTLDLHGNTLNFNGNSFTNNGTFVGTSSGSLLYIGGTGATLNVPALNLRNLTLNRSNGIKLTGNVTITNTLTLTNGVLNTDNDTIFFTNSASNPTETNGKRIDGNAVMQARTIGTSSFTFLGAYFAAGQNLGSVTISRRTGNLAVVSNGIKCQWDIDAQYQPTNGRSMTYNWFNAWDNGHTFGNGNKGQVYFSTDNGINWTAIGNLVEPVVGSGNTTRAMTVTTTHYSQWTISSQDSPLPVTLSSFTSSVKLNNVTLNWATTSELNNKGFDIERTEAGSNNYTKVGFIEGKGTTNNVSNYTYTDSKLNAGKYSYRIKQVDFNGNFEYFSLSSSIEIGAPKKFTLSQNYPNPFNPSTKIDYEIPADSKVNITIYDISGKEVQQVVNENQKAGYYTAQFNASRLSSGTYFYKLTVNGANGSEVLTKKMTLVK